jgi:hypothetical protein
MRVSGSRGVVASLAAALVGFVTVAPAVGATPVTFHVDLRYSCVYFYGAASTAYTVSRLDGTLVLDRDVVATDGGGMGQACFADAPTAGQELRAVTAGYARTMTVPAFSMRNDRATDVVSGAAPAGRTVNVGVDRYATGTYGDGAAPYERTVTATASGTYSVDVTADGGFRGGDALSAWVTTAAGDSLFTGAPAEHVRVQRGSSRVDGWLSPGDPVELVLRNATGGIRGRARLVGLPDNPSWGRFMTANGATVVARAGDKVVGDLAPDATFTIPDMTIVADSTTDVVTLTCPGMPGQGAIVIARRADFSASVTRVGVTNASGVRSYDVTASVDLEAGDVLEGTCRLDSGDEIHVRAVVAP